jgi:fucose permease
MAAGMAAAATLAQPWFALAPLMLAVFLNSTGSTVATPASSQILQRYAPPKWAPLVFSIKQTGVPMGLAIAGLVLAPLADQQGWRIALIALAVLCLVIGAGLQPVREEFDKDRDPHARPSWTDFPNTIREVLTSAELRLLAGAAFVFVGIQAVFMSFTITYFVELGYELGDAGPMFGIVVCIAVPARIFWGWLGSTYVKPPSLLAFLAILMAIATAWMGWFEQSWSWWALIGVSGFVSLTVLSWHGILLSEAARLARKGDAGRLTGGVLAFGAAGQIVFPLVFRGLLFFESYPIAFVIIAFPALFVSWAMLRPNRAAQ